MANELDEMMKRSIEKAVVKTFMLVSKNWRSSLTEKTEFRENMEMNDSTCQALEIQLCNYQNKKAPNIELLGYLRVGTYIIKAHLGRLDKGAFLRSSAET